VSLSELYIYEVVHGAESVESHLDTFREHDLEPDFIGLEVPEDTTPNAFRKFLSRSPGAALALYVSLSIQKRIRNWGSASGSGVGEPTETKAGRRFGEENDIEPVKVDMERDEILNHYAAQAPQGKDLMEFGLAVLFPIIGIAVSAQTVWNIYRSGATVPLVLIGLFTIAFLLCICLLFSLKFLAQVSGRFTREIRSVRDQRMYDLTREGCKGVDGAEALIIAGKNHSEGLETLAKQDNAEAEIITSASAGEFGKPDSLFEGMKMVYRSYF